MAASSSGYISGVLDVSKIVDAMRHEWVVIGRGMEEEYPELVALILKALMPLLNVFASLWIDGTESEKKTPRSLSLSLSLSLLYSHAGGVMKT